ILDDERSSRRDRQLAAALVMAAWYDRRDAIALLLDRGVDPGLRAEDGQTALHVASYQGHDQLVELLLEGGAPVNVLDDSFRTPPLVWALHAWLVEHKGPSERYRATVTTLVNAGTRVEPEWLEH